MTDQTKIECPECFGKGNVPDAVDTIPAPAPPEPVYSTCARCGGTGRIAAPPA